MDPPKEWKKLNSAQLRDKLVIKTELHDFFNNIAFRKGWSKPRFTHDEVDDLFDLAAEVAVRIRIDIDKHNPGWKLRLTIGGAKEFLWQVEKIDDRDVFVKALVNSIFKDQKGYVEGLNAEIVSKYLDWVKLHVAKDHDLNSIDQRLKECWGAANVTFGQVLAQVEQEGVNPQHAAHLQGLLRLVEKINHQLDTYKHTLEQRPKKNNKKNKQKQHQHQQQQQVKAPEPSQPQEKTSAAPAAIPEAMEVATPAEEKEAPAAAASDKEEKSVRRERRTFEEKRVDESSPSHVSESESGAQSGSEKETQTETHVLPQAQQTDEPGLLKIKRVAEDVTQLKTELKTLSSESESLTLESLGDDMVAGVKKIESLQKKCLALSHELMKELLTLDEIVASNATRPKRKEQVNIIQNTLDDAERVNSKLRDLLTSLKERGTEDEHKAAAEKQKEAEERALREAEVRLKRELELGKQLTGESTPPTPKQQHETSQPRSKQQQEEEESRKRKEEAAQQQATAAAAAAAAKKPAPAPAAPSPQAASPQVEKHQDESSSESTEGGALEPVRPPARAAQEPQQRREPPQTLNWRSLKLKPKFEVKEYADAFVVAGYIPGMREEDLDIDLGKDESSLEVKGFREPSREEELAMRRQLQAYLMQSGQKLRDRNDENLALLQLGAGRYGSFAQVFELPQNVDVAKISASYNSGVLKVVIPKKPQHQQHRPAPAPVRHPHRGGANPFGYANPYDQRGRFLDDDDAWW